MASLFDNTTLSDEGIRSLIRIGLPSEYRLVAWKYLLRLGGNAKEFGRLVALGPHSGKSQQVNRFSFGVVHFSILLEMSG